MTKPKSEKPEGESAAVGVRTDAERKQAAAKVQTADEEANDRDDIDNDGVEPDKAKRRIGRLRDRRAEGRGASGGAPNGRGVSKAASSEAKDASDRPDEESADGEKPSDEAELSDAVDADEVDADEVEDAVSDDTDVDETVDDAAGPAKAKRRISWPQVVVYGLLPAVALVLAGAAGFLKWQDSSVRETQLARIESLAAAKDSTIALLSYKSDSVEKDLEGAKSRMTGAFKDSYSQLIKDVVIPGAKREHISATATVPASAAVSATPNHAVVLLFVNQTAVVDKSPPADSVSSVRVTLDKVDGRWLISGFDPV
jgi:Mce-associated membrane protein